MIFRTTPLSLMMHITSLVCALGTWIVSALFKLISEDFLNKWMQITLIEKDRRNITSGGGKILVNADESAAASLKEHLI